MYAERFREFSGLVSRAEKALQRVKTENVKDYGLRGVHVSCLLALHERPEGLTATEVASVCGVDRAQISRVTAELRGLDLVCEASPGPRRRYRGALELTEEGRAAAAEMAGIVDGKAPARQRGYPPEELTVFYRVFGAIVERLEKL